ncbi:MAG: 3-dehydroquinate synthase [Rhodothermia bacterium]|nr:MAG: 3-dehydroquinate synthase [Rhodothermia bacterium]
MPKQTPDHPLVVNLADNRSYPILFAPLCSVPELLRRYKFQPGRVLLVTDENVGPLYAEELLGRLSESNWQPRLLTLTSGESSKSIARLSELYDSALTWNIDRTTPMLALGGGVIGDIAGFAASTLLRGLPLVQLPTTLLAQVDSSIGGKTGINHESGKNLIGTFYQPAFVCSDPNTLKTLPEREWTSGLSEVIKHALIADSDFFDWLDERLDLVLDRDESTVDEMIARAARIKANIVSLDEREMGVRATLNFGHTFAHALEKVSGYGHLTHGEAVLVGMKAAVALSAQNSSDLDVEHSMSVLSRLPMPTIPSSLAFGRLIDAMRSDKKRASGRIRFVLLQTIGEAYVTSKIEEKDAEAAWETALTVD